MQIARKEGTGVQEYIQQMPDGRTRIQREVEGGSVTIYFSEKDDEGTLEKSEIHDYGCLRRAKTP